MPSRSCYHHWPSGYTSNSTCCRHCQLHFVVQVAAHHQPTPCLSTSRQDLVQLPLPICSSIGTNPYAMRWHPSNPPVLRQCTALRTCSQAAAAHLLEHAPQRAAKVPVVNGHRGAGTCQGQQTLTLQAYRHVTNRCADSSMPHRRLHSCTTGRTAPHPSPAPRQAALPCHGLKVASLGLAVSCGAPGAHPPPPFTYKDPDTQAIHHPGAWPPPPPPPPWARRQCTTHDAFNLPPPRVPHLDQLQHCLVQSLKLLPQTRVTHHAQQPPCKTAKGNCVRSCHAANHWGPWLHSHLSGRLWSPSQTLAHCEV